jgi:hypothetical protein
MDLVRAELAGRGPASPAASPEDLIRVLLGGFSEEHS